MYYGDCLEVMRGWRDESVDLIYLDPPFNSKADYNILFGKAQDKGKDKQDLAQMTAFTDTWQWDAAAAERVEKISKAIEHPAHYAIKSFEVLFRGEGNGMLAYLSYMAERLAEMPRLLKSTGSIYLHCDPAASNGLKTIMDEVFGRANFRDEVFWKRATSAQKGSQYAPKKWGSNVDILLFYSKTDEVNLSPFVQLTDAETTVKFNRVDENGERYSTEAAPIWRSPGMGARPNLCYEWRGFVNPHPSGWRLSKPRLEEEYQKGNIVIRGDGRLERRKYLRDYAGAQPGNLWDDINPAAGNERLGYPTQKPIALLKRIVEASSNQGDIVLDPFCGCGTTIEAAHLLKRKWLGIDISTYALEVIRRERMKDMQIPLSGVPMDLASATSFARNNPFDFEKWAVTRIPGFAPNTVQRGDGGIDGRARIWGGEKDNDLCIAQVKGGEAPSVDSVKAFAGMLIGNKAAIGVYITLRPLATPTVKKCIADAGKIAIGAKQYPRLVMYSIQEHFDNRPPNLPTFAHPRTGEAYQQDVTDLLA